MAERESLEALVGRVVHDPARIAAVSSAVAERFLARSRHARVANFTRIGDSDVALLFDLYDELAFDGLCQTTLGTAPLSFKVSSRMTRTGGTTTSRHPRGRPDLRRYEITISSEVLFRTFAELERTVLVNGVECRTRLEAMQRVLEHEMTHLVEMLVWDKSRCSEPRFQSIVHRMFGHSDYRHQMVTAAEVAREKYGVRPGVRVRFTFEGVERRGVVARITKRATVLVEDARGQPYSDGKRYLKFYVPAALLTPESASADSPSSRT